MRGDHPGLVHIISAMEACNTYKPWHDKQTHRTFLRPDAGKCLHYYFYFIDAELGLIYLRVPTWCPFRLQFYCNGHSWLARQLTAAGIGFTLADNAFLRIDDWERAQTLANGLSPDVLRRVLDRYAHQCCPVLDVFAQSYHWSFTPRIWCSARQPSSNPSINSFPGRPSSLSKPNTSPPSSATGSLPNSPKRSAVNSQRGSRGPASGRKRPETIYFLGFTLYCTRNLKGNFRIGMRTEKSRLRRSLTNLQDLMRQVRHLSIREQAEKLNRVLRGHYAYYGIAGNFRALQK